MLEYINVCEARALVIVIERLIKLKRLFVPDGKCKPCFLAK